MNRRWLLIYALLYVVFLYLPVALLPLFSFNDAITASFPLSGITTRWYEALGNEPQLVEALSNSLIVAISASMCATLPMRLISCSTAILRRFVTFARVFPDDSCTQHSAIV